MNQKRLDALSDGIFAIVMTVLVFDIRIPEHVGEIINDKTILLSLVEMYPIFLSFLLAFTLLFTYWRSHNFIASVLAKGIDSELVNHNAFFFFFVILIPFSAKMFSVYSYSNIAIIVFALNIIIVGLSLFFMRRHVIHAETIQNEPVTKRENEHANMHILFPVFAATVAIIVSFANKDIALVLFTLAILFNFSQKSTKYTFHIIDIFRPKVRREKKLS